MEAIHEARYWARTVLVTDAVSPGAAGLRDHLVDWHRENPEVLRADAAAFLISNAVGMYLIPIQGSASLAAATRGPFIDRWPQGFEVFVDGDALGRVEPDEGLVARMHDDLDLLLDRAR